MELAKEKIFRLAAEGTLNKGLLFELFVLMKVEKDVASGKLGLMPSNIKIFHRKKYNSPDGISRIEADVAAELTRPDAREPMLIFVWECKNHSSKIGRPAVQKFFGDIQELGASRIKGIIASPVGFTRWARSYAFKHGVGLWHIEMPSKWHQFETKAKWRAETGRVSSGNRTRSTSGGGSGDVESVGQIIMVVLGLIVGVFGFLFNAASKSCSAPKKTMTESETRALRCSSTLEVCTKTISIHISDANMRTILKPISETLNTRLFIDHNIRQEIVSVSAENEPISEVLDTICARARCYWAINPGGRQAPILVVGRK